VVGYAAYPAHTEIPATDTQMPTISIETRDIAADLFEVPAGYREAAMPANPAIVEAAAAAS
jgi:hypothetical protein